MSRDPLAEWTFAAFYVKTKREESANREEIESIVGHEVNAVNAFLEKDPIQKADPLGLHFYRTPRCQVTIFYGHSDCSRLWNTVSDKCGAQTSVGCQSNYVHKKLPGLLPGASGTDVNSAFKYFNTDAHLADNFRLYKENIEAARTYAKEVLCKAPCCCKEVIIEPVVIRKAWPPEEWIAYPGFKQESVKCGQ